MSSKKLLMLTAWIYNRKVDTAISSLACRWEKEGFREEGGWDHAGTSMLCSTSCYTYSTSCGRDWGEHPAMRVSAIPWDLFSDRLMDKTDTWLPWQETCNKTYWPTNSTHFNVAAELQQLMKERMTTSLERQSTAHLNCSLGASSHLPSLFGLNQTQVCVTTTVWPLLLGLYWCIWFAWILSRNQTLPSYDQLVRTGHWTTGVKTLLVHRCFCKFIYYVWQNV